MPGPTGHRNTVISVFEYSRDHSEETVTPIIIVPYSCIQRYYQKIGHSNSLSCDLPEDRVTFVGHNYDLFKHPVTALLSVLSC